MNITKCKTQAEYETQQKCKAKTHKGDELQMNIKEHKMQVKSITQWECKRYGKTKTSKHDGEWKNETYENEKQDGNGNNKQWKTNLKP